MKHFFESSIIANCLQPSRVQNECMECRCTTKAPCQAMNFMRQLFDKDSGQFLIGGCIPEISVIVTAYNEEKTAIPVCMEISRVMGKRDYEIVFVDDGSVDKTYENLRNISDKRIRIIRIGSRTGKCNALYRGMEDSAGRIMAMLDADLQDDPKDMARMLDYIDRGYDFVCGWRRDRKDGPTKRMFSFLGNSAINLAFGTNLHDHACPVKVFRKECISGVKYFKGMHRFMGVIAEARGFRLKECTVRHRPRVYGKSKCGTIKKLETAGEILMVKSMMKNIDSVVKG